MKGILRNHGYEFFVTILAQISFQLFSLLIFRQLSNSLSSVNFGFVGLWLVFNTSVSVIFSSPISALALRFSGFKAYSETNIVDNLISTDYPYYLKKLCNVFVSRYVLFCKYAAALSILFLYLNFDIFVALILSIPYGLSFGLIIILLGFLQGRRQRSHQLIIALLEGTIKLFLFVVLTKVLAPNHFLAMLYLTLGSAFSCIAAYLILPFISSELVSNNHRFKFYSAHKLIKSSPEKLDPRECDLVSSATKFGIISGFQIFLEVYVVGAFYGLEATAALVILTKFAFTPSVFLANAVLAYVSPIMYRRSEISYKTGETSLLLKFFKNYSFALLLVSSILIGLFSNYMSPFVFEKFFPPGYHYLSEFVAYFVFSGFLTTLSSVNFPIIETFSGSSLIYSSRSILVLCTIILNCLLTSLFGLNGAAFSAIISAFLAYYMFNVRFIFKEIC